MIKPVIHRAVQFLAVLFNFTCLTASAQIGCPTASIPIPLHVPSEILAVKLSGLGIAAWNGLDASFLLENQTHKDIAYLTIVIGFESKNGNYLQSVVFEAAPDARQPSTYLIPAERVQLIQNPIVPEEKIWISGRSPYTPEECPASAELTMLDIRFGDGSSVRWESSDWWTMPLLRDYPLYLSISDAKSWTADEYFFIGRVNTEGQLDYITPYPETVEVPSEKVADALKKLTFSPGLHNGKPCVGNFIIIVKFMRPGKAAAKQSTREPAKQLKSVVFISFDSPRDLTEIDWRFDFGRGFGYATTIVHPER